MTPKKPAARPTMTTLSPRKTEEKKKPLSNYEIEKNLKESLKSTDDGLKKFLESLKQAGMADAAQGYRAMSMVLIQQRLWADEHHRDALVPLFRSIAQTASDLHRIFGSFADVMKPLKEIDKLKASAVSDAVKAESTQEG